MTEREKKEICRGYADLIINKEPGYIMGLMAITPMIDYSQGNDFDLNLETIDDLHKPALDGIGYQDLIQEQMVGATSKYEGGSYI